ncbi:hypothetical protein [Burkholderia sp. YIM B11467]
MPPDAESRRARQRSSLACWTERHSTGWWISDAWRGNDAESIAGKSSGIASANWSATMSRLQTSLGRAPTLGTVRKIQARQCPPGIYQPRATTAIPERTGAGRRQRLRQPGAWTRTYIIATRWAELLSRDQLPERTAHIIRFAVKGLWFDEVCGLRPLDPAQRAAFVDSLLAMTRPLAPSQ